MNFYQNENRLRNTKKNSNAQDAKHIDFLPTIENYFFTAL